MLGLEPWVNELKLRYVKVSWNQLCCDWDRYDKTWYREEENIKKDIWTAGRGRNIENKNNQDLKEPYKKLYIADINPALVPWKKLC